MIQEPTTRTLRRIADDLWETPTDRPAPGLTTHAYLWRSPAAGNVLFYSVATTEDLDALADHGGVGHQYLSHRDEAGPVLLELERRFGTRLHASPLEVADVARFRQPDVLFTDGRDATGVEVLSTPGHSPGSTSFVVDGAAGRYLFVGDTMYRLPDGSWSAGYLPGISDRDALLATLDVLAEVRPGLVISSAFAGDAGAHPVDADGWRRWVDEARRSLRSP